MADPPAERAANAAADDEMFALQVAKSLKTNAVVDALDLHLKKRYRAVIEKLEDTVIVPNINAQLHEHDFKLVKAGAPGRMAYKLHRSEKQEDGTYTFTPCKSTEAPTQAQKRSFPVREPED